jgi:hypothetical protein
MFSESFSQIEKSCYMYKKMLMEESYPRLCFMARNRSGVDFTNILRTAFFSRKSNKQLYCTCSFGLNIFGTKEIDKKAVRKMLVKLTTDLFSDCSDWPKKFMERINNYNNNNNNNNLAGNSFNASNDDQIFLDAVQNYAIQNLAR